MPSDKSELVINLRGQGWNARLHVDPPQHQQIRVVDFPLTWMADDRQPRLVTADVWYTTATNTTSSPEWDRWHVKVYRCREQGEAIALRGYLRDQARHILRANASLPGAGSPARPPWGVVPVQIVRGDTESERLDGTVVTQLAIHVTDMLAAADRFPTWFAESPEVAARTVIAISPHIDEFIWPDYYSEHVPATQHLKAFQGLATGLDVMHSLDTVHCDVKPSNVCRVTVAGSSAYVLIDTDAATKADSAPRFLRFTPQYTYAGVLRAYNGSSRSRDPQISRGLLLAQDRFGFALVVLSALAGRDWVYGNLLAADNGAAGRRRADDPAEVAAALTAHWPDPRWKALAQELSRAFAQDIEDSGWQLSAWLNRVIAASQLEAERSAVASRYAHEIAEVRAEANRIPAVGQERLQRGYTAARQRIRAVAARSARRSRLAVVSGFVLVTAILIVGQFGWRH